MRSKGPWKGRVSIIEGRGFRRSEMIESKGNGGRDEESKLGGKKRRGHRKSLNSEGMDCIGSKRKGSEGVIGRSGQVRGVVVRTGDVGE